LPIPPAVIYVILKNLPRAVKELRQILNGPKRNEPLIPDDTIIQQDAARLACFLRIALIDGKLTNDESAFLSTHVPAYLLQTEKGNRIYREGYNYVRKSGKPLSFYVSNYYRKFKETQADIDNLIREILELSYKDDAGQIEKDMEIKDAATSIGMPMDSFEKMAIDSLKHNMLNSSAINFGSGFAIEESGFIITNYHVIKDSKQIKVKVGRRYCPARPIISDQDLDLAVIKIDLQLPALSFHQSPVKSSQAVLALGFPDPRAYGFTIKVTDGAINCLNGYQDDASQFQISTLLDRGNSGGPLIDEKSGGVVGVLAQQHVKNVKCGYAIKGESVIKFLNSHPAFASSIKYVRYRGLRREIIAEEATHSVVPILSYF